MTFRRFTFDERSARTKGRDFIFHIECFHLVFSPIDAIFNNSIEFVAKITGIYRWTYR